MNENRQDHPYDRSGTDRTPSSLGAVPAPGEGASRAPIPDRATYITGWRTWSIVRGVGLCSSGGSPGFPWPKKKPLVAICGRGEEHQKVPDEDCLCGIYAYKDREELGVVKNPRFAFGEVALWGHVVEAEGGYRAEFAYPLRLIVSKDTSVDTVRSLEEYGVPVELIDYPPLPILQTPSVPRTLDLLWYGLLWPLRHPISKIRLIGVVLLSILLCLPLAVITLALVEFIYDRIGNLTARWGPSGTILVSWFGMSVLMGLIVLKRHMNHRRLFESMKRWRTMKPRTVGKTR